MKTYLISYDLIRPETSPEYTRLFNLIKTSVYWAKPLRSLWLIKSNLSSMQIAAEIKKVVDMNDKFIVIEVTKEWTSFNLDLEVVNWMRGNIE